MFKILDIAANFFLILNFILFAYRFKNQNTAYKFYTMYLGAIVCVQVSLEMLIVFGYQNLFLSHFYFCLQFIFLSLFFLELMKENYQKLIITFNLILTPAIVGFTLYLNPSQIHEFCLIEILLTSISIIVYSTFHFYNMLSAKKEFYFITCGILIYLFGSTLTFLLRNLHVVYGKEFSYTLEMLNIVLYLVYLTFIFLDWKLIKSSNSYARK